MRYHLLLQRREQLDQSDKINADKIRRALAELDQQGEDLTQKLFFLRYLPMLEKWQIPDCKRRLKELERFWRTEIPARRLKRI